MTDFYTALCATENRSPAEREQSHFQALPQQVNHARQATAAFAEILQDVDALAVPTCPIAPTLAELAADPIGPNSRLGTYTNFVNLLDLCGLAVPGPFRTDGFPAGITLLAPRGNDLRLAQLGRACGIDVGTAAAALLAKEKPLPTE